MHGCLQAETELFSWPAMKSVSRRWPSPPESQSLLQLISAVLQQEYQSLGSCVGLLQLMTLSPLLPARFHAENQTGAHLDQHGRKSLGAKLLVDAQEVDLGHAEHLPCHLHCGWHACDEAHKLARPGHAHAHMPLGEEAGGVQRPLQELSGVLEAAKCTARVSATCEAVEQSTRQGG